MNKVNLCWVISDGRLGHEKQSVAVAKLLAHNFTVHRFNSTGFQSIFSPNPIGHRVQPTQWLDLAPQSDAQLVISCGRKAAAAAARLKQQFCVPHIHILNPKGDLGRYDALLLPQHDNIARDNVCLFNGSIHDVLKRKKPDNPLLAIMVGNPTNTYWEQWEFDLKRWLSFDQPLAICGSPRLSSKGQSIIRSTAKDHVLWLNDSDGPNPYNKLLNTASHFAVSSDSINMINECHATGQNLEWFGGTTHLSDRHQHFLEGLSQHMNTHTSPWEHPLEALSGCQLIQKLVNSPSSFNSG